MNEVEITGGVCGAGGGATCPQCVALETALEEGYSRPAAAFPHAHPTADRKCGSWFSLPHPDVRVGQWEHVRGECNSLKARCLLDRLGSERSARRTRAPDGPKVPTRIPSHFLCQLGHKLNSTPPRTEATMPPHTAVCGPRPSAVLGPTAAVRTGQQRHRHTPGAEPGRHTGSSARPLGRRGNDAVALPPPLSQGQCIRAL